jgi:Arc/MetJ-type ribon-helix-helix transcriptional regulator
MAVRDPTPVVALRLPEELLRAIDRLARGKEFVSRSDVIRTLLRQQLELREQREAA